MTVSLYFQDVLFIEFKSPTIPADLPVTYG